MAGNVSGGIRQDSDYAQDIYFGTELDLERLLGWRRMTFRLTGIDRAGNSIDADIGSVYSVMQLVGGQTYFLYGVSLEKQWLDDQLSLKFGRITATDDFAGSPLYGLYLNNSFDVQIRAVLLDGVMTSYPLTRPGRDGFTMQAPARSGSVIRRCGLIRENETGGLTNLSPWLRAQSQWVAGNRE